jgi:hypothetical protein
LKRPETPAIYDENALFLPLIPGTKEGVRSCSQDRRRAFEILGMKGVPFDRDQFDIFLHIF